MFEILIFFITLIFTGYIFNKSINERFDGTTSSLPIKTMNVTNSSDINSMQVIDFSQLDKLEKIERLKKSEKLQSCLKKYSGNKRSILRDVNELMYKKENEDNIYSDTTVEGDRLNQLSFW